MYCRDLDILCTTFPVRCLKGMRTVHMDQGQRVESKQPTGHRKVSDIVPSAVNF